MNLRLLSALLLLFCLAPAGTAQPPPMTPNSSDSLAVPAPPGLQLGPDERRFFALGTALSRGAFAYAELAGGASRIARTRSKIAQVGQLGRLEPVARRNRLDARDGFAEAARLLRELGAPPAALAPVVRAAGLLDGPLPISSEARPLLLFNGDAARTLSALNEFQSLSSLPEDPALQRWLASAPLPRSAQVWYGEGEIAELARIAAAHAMPELLPPAEQLATDLRGLRDWLAGRLPDTPTPEQAALQSALESFLQASSLALRPGVRSRKPLTLPQLQALGDISRQLQALVFGPPGETPPKTSSAHT